MTPEELDAIRARAEAASAAPWTSVGGGGLEMDGARDGYIISSVAWTIPVMQSFYRSPRRREDTEFVTHAREDIPALLVEVDRLREAHAECDAIIAQAWRSSENWRKIYNETFDRLRKAGQA